MEPGKSPKVSGTIKTDKETGVSTIEMSMLDFAGGNPIPAFIPPPKPHEIKFDISLTTTGDVLLGRIRDVCQGYSMTDVTKALDMTNNHA